MTTKGTFNCTFDYPGKWTESEVLEWNAKGRFSSEPSVNSFYYGDNFPILQLLRKYFSAQIDLIYIDPPFGTGRRFANIGQEVAYSDELIEHQFIEFLRRRLIAMRELLSEQGSIYLHIDKKIGHYVKIIMDEVFGAENFLNDISRIKCNPKNFDRKAFGNYSDMILFYAKNRDKHIWNEIRQPLTPEEIAKLFPKSHPEHGPYTTHPLHAPGETVDGDTGKMWKNLMPPKGRHWRYGRKVLDQLDADGWVEWSDTGNPRKRVFAKDHKGKKVQDVWEMKDKGLSYVSYPTEKNRDLLQRVILHSSNENGIVLDAFAGSGGTLISAHELGRRWIGIDQSEKAQEVISMNFEKAGIPFSQIDYLEDQKR
ncbi:UNVERIFIED_CONTAM: hypothetical protein GTU68_006221 [Idotea baltica]|nr:hypothetical protein [Idotea baltica]